MPPAASPTALFQRARRHGSSRVCRGPEETNRRLHLLAQGVSRPRLSIAFDGITLYGADSDEDPGSIGKIGEGGVAIDSWEDMKLLLEGFHIPDISTSMTINGPAPMLLAMYFVAAQEIELERAEREKGAPLCRPRSGRSCAGRPCRSCGGPCRPTS